MQVGAVLESYAERGVFRGFSSVGGGKFKVVWHYGRQFDIRAEPQRRILTCASVLPDVERRSQMEREYRRFVAEQQSITLAEHRRIDPARAAAAVTRRAGGFLRKRITTDAGASDSFTIRGAPAPVTLGVKLKLDAEAPDWDYATRKLVSLVEETYLVFLRDGTYFEYLVETFQLDPDHM